MRLQGMNGMWRARAGGRGVPGLGSGAAKGKGGLGALLLVAAVALLLLLLLAGRWLGEA